MLEAFWTWLEMQPLAAHIGETAWFPFIESVHVLSAMFVVGTVLMADLRLLGWAALRYPLTVVTREIVPWTWGAFAIATVTGVALFIARASAYVANPAFLAKVALLLLAASTCSCCISSGCALEIADVCRWRPARAPYLCGLASCSPGGGSVICHER